MEFIRAGGDLCLICHRQDYIMQAYEQLVETVERDPTFARRVADSARRMLAFKKKWKKVLHHGKQPPAATIEKLSRKLWEFGEQVRLESLP